MVNVLVALFCLAVLAFGGLLAWDEIDRIVAQADREERSA